MPIEHLRLSVEGPGCASAAGADNIGTSLLESAMENMDVRQEQKEGRTDIDSELKQCVHMQSVSRTKRIYLQQSGDNDVVRSQQNP